MSLNGCRVLIVEDEPLVAMMLEEQVADAGGVVVGTVQTADTAIAWLERDPPSAVILDIGLGGNLSFEVARRCEALAIRFVFATGYTELSVPDQFAHIRVISKPFSDMQLLDALAPICAGPE